MTNDDSDITDDVREQSDESDAVAAEHDDDSGAFLTLGSTDIVHYTGQEDTDEGDE